MRCGNHRKKTICCWMAFSFIQLTAVRAPAETVYYVLDNVILDDSEQITGIFSWTYTAGDFENGVSQIFNLDIPHSAHNQDDLITVVEPSQIEITFEGNAHDEGVDIKMVLLQPLTPFTSSVINTNHAESKYSIGGNGFYDGFFLGGSIVPTNLTLNIIANSSGFISVAWMPDIPGVVLQETPNLFSNWVNSVSGSTNPIAVPVAAPALFYRVGTP